MSFNNQIKLHFGSQIAPKMMWSAGKGNSEPKSSVKKETLTVGNTSFINSPAKSEILSAGKKTFQHSHVIGLTPNVGEK